MKKFLKIIIFYSVFGLILYFWISFFIIIGIVLILIVILSTIFYGLMKHVSRYNSFVEMRNNKPWWFIFGNKLYIKLIDYIEDVSKKKNNSSIQTEIEEAMMFLGLGFYKLKDISKAEVKRKWKNAQRIYHPDSGTNPDINKSQLANKYKDLLLREIERNT